MSIRMNDVVICGIKFSYYSDKGCGIQVYNEKGEHIGTYDNVADLQHDVEENPDEYR